MEWPAWASSSDDRETERLIEQAELDALFEGAEPDDPGMRGREEDRTYGPTFQEEMTPLLNFLIDRMKDPPEASER